MIYYQVKRNFHWKTFFLHNMIKTLCCFCKWDSLLESTKKMWWMSLIFISIINLGKYGIFINVFFVFKKFPSIHTDVVQYVFLFPYNKMLERIVQSQTKHTVSSRFVSRTCRLSLMGSIYVWKKKFIECMGYCNDMLWSKK